MTQRRRKNDTEETSKIIETFIQQLKSSGYNRKESREIVVAGLLGWKRKIKRMKDDGQEFYRNANSTLATRCRKKLLEKNKLVQGKSRKKSQRRG